MPNPSASAAVADEAAIAGIPFTIASRSQRRFSNTQTVSNLSAGGTFAIVPLTATGWVRKVVLYFTQTMTVASGAAVVAGDAPWNLITGVSLSDATGQPVYQPISGYNMYLLNKYLPSGGTVFGNTDVGSPQYSPQAGRGYAFAASGTSGSAQFRLELPFEQDSQTGYGCIPNLDSNAALQLKVDYAVYTVAMTGTTPSAATLKLDTYQHYFAPVGKSLSGSPVEAAPPGAGDYLETRYETQTVNASSENLIVVNARGGLIKGTVGVSRAAGVRTAITAGSNVGAILDNMPIDESYPFEQFMFDVQCATGYYGAELTTSYAPLTAGTAPGTDRGVIPWLFYKQTGYRDAWLNTRVGSLLQLKVTPGASATQFELLTQIGQIKDVPSFYDRS